MATWLKFNWQFFLTMEAKCNFHLLASSSVTWYNILSNVGTLTNTPVIPLYHIEINISGQYSESHFADPPKLVSRHDIIKQQSVIPLSAPVLCDSHGGFAQRSCNQLDMTQRTAADTSVIRETGSSIYLL